jgi:hypothetical protein
MLNSMRPEGERAFRVDDPVAQYWLHNCVGFGVRGLAGGGVVDGIGLGDEGVAVLAVRRRPLHVTTRIPASRVEAVDPWAETVVLRSRSRVTRERRVAQARSGAGVLATTTRGGATAAASRVRVFLAAAAASLLALAHRLAPHARRAWTTLGMLARAYAAEAARAYREQRDAVAAWREQRRRSAWGDDSPLTRAGADDVDARSEDRVRS